jgi:dTDP-4-dehydrorhamnose 3,5-epimerase
MFDVMVDLRQDSPTYGRWHGEELRADRLVALYIPRGFAHGFQTLVDDTEIDYEITPAYAAESARGVRYDDRRLAISWPLPEVIVSDRDLSLPAFGDVAA